MFKNFYIKDLFDVINNPQLDKRNFIFSDSAEYPYFTRTENNNGILGYVEYLDEEHKIPGNSLAVGMISMKFHYMQHDFYAGQFTKTLIPKFRWFNEKIALYFMAILNKHSAYYQSYLVRHFKDKVNETVVSLPVIESADPGYEYELNDIDWQSIESRISELEQERIAELEQERIAELEQYLIATGLNDYELTDEDKAVLSFSRKAAPDKTGDHADAGGKREEEFLISDVFDICKGKRLKKADQIKGNTPFIGSSDSNNGVTGYIGQKPLFDGGAISVSYNGSVGQVFYQEQPFWASDDINVLILKRHELAPELYEYLGTTLKKAGTQFSYSYKWNTERMKATVIYLPIQTDFAGNPILDPDCTWHPAGYIPDWDYMEKYIRAVEKLVIANVVKWKDEEIKRTKEIVNASHL